MYGKYCTILARVEAWQKRLREGRAFLIDDALSGTEKRITDNTVQLVGQITERAVATEVGLGI